MTGIRAFFGDKVINGIEFVYGSGGKVVTSSIGLLEGHCESVQLGTGELFENVYTEKYPFASLETNERAEAMILVVRNILTNPNNWQDGGKLT